VVFNTEPFTVLPDNYILITASMHSETGFPSSHELKSYVASKSRLKLAARAILSADAGLLVCALTSSGWDFLLSAYLPISFKSLPSPITKIRMATENGMVWGSQGSLKVTGNIIIRQSAYEFLLTFYIVTTSLLHRF